MKRVSVTEFDNKFLMKVEHQVKGMIAGVSVFMVSDEGAVQEIMPGFLSPVEEKKLASRDYDRVATPEEIQMAHQILVQRDQYMLERVTKTMEAIGGNRLLRLIEMGGRYFAYSMHDNLAFTRLAEVLLTPDELPVDFMEVPLDYLPLLAENLSGVLMQEKKKGMTIMFGEGLFIRLKRTMNQVVATILRLDGEGKDGKLRAPLAFTLKQENGAWLHLPNPTLNKEKMEAEMEKALNHVLNELALNNLKK